MASEQREFQHKEFRFQMVLDSGPGGFVVRSFLDRKPISPRYTASYEVHIDYYMKYGEHIKEHLFAVAKWDIENEMYVIVKEGEPHKGVEIKPNVLSMVSGVRDPLTEAYPRTPVGSEGIAKLADLQSLDGFQVVVVSAQSWEIEGRIKILDMHRESQSGRKLVDFIRFSRLK